jgi:hypothetical protein
MPAPDSDTDVPAVRQDQAGGRQARHETAVAAVFRQVQDVAVGKPGELGCELVALSRRRRDRHGEAVLQLPRDLAFQAAEVIDIGDDAVADFAADRGDQRHAARRHVNDLAREFAPVGQHVAPQQTDPDTLKAPPVLGMR